MKAVVLKFVGTNEQFGYHLEHLLFVFGDSTLGEIQAGDWPI